MVADVVDGASPNQGPFSNFDGSSAGQYFHDSSDCRHFHEYDTKMKLKIFDCRSDCPENSLTPAISHDSV